MLRLTQFINKKNKIFMLKKILIVSALILSSFAVSAQEKVAVIKPDGVFSRTQMLLLAKINKTILSLDSFSLVDAKLITQLREDLKNNSQIVAFGRSVSADIVLITYVTDKEDYIVGRYTDVITGKTTEKKLKITSASDAVLEIAVEQLVKELFAAGTQMAANEKERQVTQNAQQQERVEAMQKRNEEMRERNLERQEEMKEKNAAKQEEKSQQVESVKMKKENAKRELFIKDSLLYESYNIKLDSLKNALNNDLLSQYFNTSQRIFDFPAERLEKTKNYQKTYEKAAEICRQKVILFSDTLTYEFYNNKFNDLKTALNNDLLSKQFNILQKTFQYSVEKLKFTKNHQKEYEKLETDCHKQAIAFTENVRKNLYKADFSKANGYTEKIAEYKNTSKYDAAINAVFIHNDKIKNEYNSNKKYFSGQIEFYEAYSSGNYKAILKAKKKGKK